MPGQQPQQCGFANAVRPDKGHPVAAQDAQVQTLHDHLVAESLGQARRFDHLFARQGAAVEQHRRSALPPDLRRAAFAQHLQRPHPALIAFPARRNALDRPFAFGLDLAVQLVAGLIFLGPDFLAPILEGHKALIALAQQPPVQPQRRAGQAAQQRAVVADDDIGRARVGQFLLQPFDGRDIQVVGRLVQQHHFRRFSHQLGQSRPAAFPA